MIQHQMEQLNRASFSSNLNPQISSSQVSKSQVSIESHPNAEARTMKFAKKVTLNFLKYSGEGEPNVLEHCYRMHSIADEDKVFIVALHLARPWFQVFCNERGLVNWDQFKQVVIGRFGPSCLITILEYLQT